MLEIPEAIIISKQINQTVSGKKILRVIAAQSPHKFAWYHGDPQKYNALLSGKMINFASGRGGMVEVRAEDSAEKVILLFSDGDAIRFFGPDEKRPDKHQLLIEFVDNTAICISVQMYGGLCCFAEGEYDNPYYLVAGEKPSPLSDQFDQKYFNGILLAPEFENLSAKALLATEQRIPGLGNGVLQDILFFAGIHPKKKLLTFSNDEKMKIYTAIKDTLAEMVAQGGRDTEKDLFGHFGGYRTRLSKNTADKPCRVCGQLIKKEAYLGGSIYFCPGCQKL